MRVGIDCSNLLAGGGVTHLCEFLREAGRAGNHEFVVWLSSAIAKKVEPARNIELIVCHIGPWQDEADDTSARASE